LLPDLYKKFEDLVDKTALIKSVFKTVAFESAVSSKTSIEQLRFFSVSFRK
jgi:hypothetical protein